MKGEQTGMNVSTRPLSFAVNLRRKSRWLRARVFSNASRYTYQLRIDQTFSCMIGRSGQYHDASGSMNSLRLSW